MCGKMNLLFFLLSSFVFSLQNIRYTILEGCPSILAIVTSIVTSLVLFYDCYPRKNLHLHFRGYSLSLDFRDKDDVSIFRIRYSLSLQLRRPIAQRCRSLSVKNNVIIVHLWRTTSLLFCLLMLEGGVKNTHQ
jgi:hypothetical protein